MSIEVHQISKTYGSQKALDSVSFSIPKGQIVGFLGPNGAGKSTLMKILTTYLSADSGQASVNDFDVAQHPQNVQRSVGYLPEHNPLYLDLYVREYLEFNAGIYNVKKARIQEVIELTGLSPEAHKKIGQLSKGYRQRVGLANALLHDPEVLILDEPTTGLDPNQLVEIRQVIKNAGKNKTVFLSTHIMQEVEAICDRVIIIDSGMIVADRPIEQIAKTDLRVIEVEFDKEIERQAFLEISDAHSIENAGANKWLLTFATDQDKRPDIFDFARKHDLRILGMSEIARNLETVFREMTGKNKPEINSEK